MQPMLLKSGKFDIITKKNKNKKNNEKDFMGLLLDWLKLPPAVAPENI